MNFCCKPQRLSLMSMEDMNYFTSSYLNFHLVRAEFILKYDNKIIIRTALNTAASFIITTSEVLWQ